MQINEIPIISIKEKIVFDSLGQITHGVILKPVEHLWSTSESLQLFYFCKKIYLRSSTGF